MRVPSKFLPVSKVTVSILAMLMALAAAVSAQDAAKAPAKTQIKNFGCVNENYYRGAQPKEGDIQDLAAMGIKTVIDLQKDVSDDERRMVEATGMTYHNIPMSDRDAPSTNQVSEFLKLINDPANYPVFVHCKGGRHRTGLVTAVYRMTHDGWDFDRSFAEMRRYDFNYGFGHTPLKNYVYAFYANLEKKKDVVVTDAKP